MNNTALVRNDHFLSLEQSMARQNVVLAIMNLANVFGALALTQYKAAGYFAYLTGRFGIAAVVWGMLAKRRKLTAIIR